MDLNYNEIHGKDKGRWMETPKKNLFLKKKNCKDHHKLHWRILSHLALLSVLLINAEMNTESQFSCMIFIH